MIYAIANEFFYDSLEIKLQKEVDEVIRTTLSIYAENYDTKIPFQSGGYVIVVTKYTEYEALLQQLNTSSDMAEYMEIIISLEDGVWKCGYFQLSSEYGVTVIFYEPKGVNI